MKIDTKNPPRKYPVGKNGGIIIQDMGTISLEPDQQITFVTSEKHEYDLCRKNWGYYATPSINDRLKKFDFKTALVRNKKNQIYIMLVEKKKLDLFAAYLKEEDNSVIEWLDERPLS